MASTLHHPPRLDVPSRAPENMQEAVELADLAQALVGDDADWMHETWTMIVARWRPAPAPGRYYSDGGKLVRDGIPEVIRGKGMVPLTLPCRDLTERYRRLFDKFLEERDEYVEHVEERGAGDLMELADLLEVVEALAVLDGRSLAEVREAQVAKREERGGFSDWLVWYGNVTPSPPAV